MPMEILAVLTSPHTVQPCLAGAAAAAAAVDGGCRIVAFHAQLAPESLVLPTEEVLTASRRAALTAREAARASALESAFRRWVAGGGPQGASTAWQTTVTGSIEDTLADRGHRADLVTLAHPRAAEDHAALHAAIFKTGRPLLLMPPAPLAGVFGRHLAIAWKASGQAEQAVRAAAPWLRRAERVSVLAVAPDDPAAAVPPALQSLLEGQGIRATLVALADDEDTVPQQLLRAAHGIGADGLVMGAYRHSRIREMLLGGVTRYMLAHADLPLFLMH